MEYEVVIEKITQLEEKCGQLINELAVAHEKIHELEERETARWTERTVNGQAVDPSKILLEGVGDVAGRVLVRQGEFEALCMVVKTVLSLGASIQELFFPKKDSPESQETSPTEQEPSKQP